MSNLRLVSKEVRYQREQFYDSLLVGGIPCTVKSIGPSYEDTHDLYGDVRESESHKTSISTFITYDEYPSIQTLKSLGWYIAGTPLPVIAHLPVLYREESTGELATFLPQLDDVISVVVGTSDPEGSPFYSRSQEFLVKKLQGVGFPDVVYYLANLVPVRREIV